MSYNLGDDPGPTDRHFPEMVREFAGYGGEGRIDVRIRRLSLGNPGDVKPVGEGVSELRIDYGPGYRVYFTKAGATVILLLCGGDKGSQGRDVVAAKKLARELKD